MYSFSSIGIADMHPIVVFVSAGTSERFTTDIHFKLEVSAAVPCWDAVHSWCYSERLSTAEFIHLCEGSVCAVDVCSWWLVCVRIGRASSRVPFWAQSLHYIQYVAIVAISLCCVISVLLYSSGWSDSNVTTTQTTSGAICTSDQPGMYGLLQGDLVCKYGRNLCYPWLYISTHYT